MNEKKLERIALLIFDGLEPKDLTAFFWGIERLVLASGESYEAMGYASAIYSHFYPQFIAI